MQIFNSSLIGIVTVLYNSDEVLPDFFSSLALQNDIYFKLYVIDNSPNDSGSTIAREYANKLKLNVEIIFNNENYGVAKGNNQGIELATKDNCDFILLANNDIKFNKGTISSLLSSLNDEISAATPKIYYHKPNNLIWYAGGNLNLWTMRSPHRGINKYDLGQFDKKIVVGYGPTCFMLFKVAVFKNIGIMDEKYFVYYDDTDFLFRMRKKNIKLMYVPESIIEHKVSSSTGGKLSSFTTYYTTRNRIYFARKNLSYINKIITIPYILITRLFFVILNPLHLAKYVFKGILDGFKIKLIKN